MVNIKFIEIGGSGLNYSLAKIQVNDEKCSYIVTPEEKDLIEKFYDKFREACDNHPYFLLSVIHNRAYSIFTDIEKVQVDNISLLVDDVYNKVPIDCCKYIQESKIIEDITSTALFYDNFFDVVVYKDED